MNLWSIAAISQARSRSFRQRVCVMNMEIPFHGNCVPPWTTTGDIAISTISTKRLRCLCENWWSASARAATWSWTWARMVGETFRLRVRKFSQRWENGWTKIKRVFTVAVFHSWKNRIGEGIPRMAMWFMLMFMKLLLVHCLYMESDRISWNPLPILQMEAR